MSVLNVQPILKHLRDRLRVNYVDEVLYSDDDLLSMINDGYLDACEQTMILQTLTTMTLSPGVVEYDLPDDFSQAVCVVSGGLQLDPLPYQDALQEFANTDVQTGYYIYARRIGVVPPPSENTGGTLLLLYAAEPVTLTTWDDGLDARFPIEYSDLLLHWVRWRVQMISGGAERIPAAQVDRAIYDGRIRDMRRATMTVSHTGPARFQHVSRRPRTARDAF
jgi:hypothetical protein